MQNPPYQWRARWGYIPPVDEQPPSPGSPPPYHMSGYENIHFTPEAFYSAYQFAPLPNPPWARAPIATPAYDFGYTFAGPPSPTSAAAWPTQGMDDDDAIPGVSPPAGLRDGMRFLHPSRNTTIHVLFSEDGSWKNSNGGGLTNFFIFVVPCCMTVQELIEQLGGGDGTGSASSSANMALTEVFETGGADWEKGMTIKYNDEAVSKKTLSTRGWTENRGGEMPPVWLVLHRTS